MNQKITKYGVTPVQRPKIKATKQLDLRGDEGRRFIAYLTKTIKERHAKTFAKLALLD